MTQSFSTKRIDEDRTHTIDFVNRLVTGETISTATVTATVYRGTDPNPSAIVSGSASISTTKVSQLIIDGLEGVIYCLKCVITTSNSQTLHGVAHLYVSDIC